MGTCSRIQAAQRRMSYLAGAGSRALSRLSPLRKPLSHTIERLAGCPGSDISLTVGGYRLQKLLNSNALGWVFLGQPLVSERPESVHIRIFRPQAWEEVRSEVLIYSQLRDLRLCPVRAWGEQDGCGFVVTPYVGVVPLQQVFKNCQAGLLPFLRNALTALEVARRAGMRCHHWSFEQFAMAPGRRGIRLIFDLGLPLQASSPPPVCEGSLRAKLAHFCSDFQPTVTMQAVLERLKEESDNDLLVAFEDLVEASPLSPSEKAILLEPVDLIVGLVCPRTVEEHYDVACEAIRAGDLDLALEFLLGGMEANPHIPYLLLGESPFDQAPRTRMSSASLAWAKVYARQAQDRWSEAHLNFLRRVMADPELGPALRQARQLQFELQRSSLLPDMHLAEEVRKLHRQFYGQPVNDLFQRLGLVRS